MNGQSITSADMKLISAEGTFLGLARGDLKQTECEIKAAEYQSYKPTAKQQKC